MEYDHVDAAAQLAQFRRNKVIEAETNAINAEIERDKLEGVAADERITKQTALPTFENYRTQTADQAEKERQRATAIHTHTGITADDIAAEVRDHLTGKLAGWEGEHVHIKELTDNAEVYGESILQRTYDLAMLEHGITAVRTRLEALQPTA